MNTRDVEEIKLRLRLAAETFVKQAPKRGDWSRGMVAWDWCNDLTREMTLLLWVLGEELSTFTDEEILGSVDRVLGTRFVVG